MTPAQVERLYRVIQEELNRLSYELGKVEPKTDDMARNLTEFEWECEHLSKKVGRKSSYLLVDFKPLSGDYSEKDWERRTLEKRVQHLSLTREVWFLVSHILELEGLNKEEHPKVFTLANELEQHQQMVLRHWIR